MPRLLLALDNVEPGLDASEAINTLAVANHTALLLTARHALAAPRLTALTLHPLAEDPAADLFARVLAQRDAVRPDDADRAHISALVAAVDGLPLAIELTAAYAAIQRLPLATVRAEVQRDGLASAALALATAALEPPATDHPGPAAAPQTERPSPPLGRGVWHTPGRAGGEVLAILVGYALVEPPAGERLRLHPLLRQYAAARLRDPHSVPSATADALGDAALAYWLAYARAHPGYAGMDALEAEAPGLMGALAWAHTHARHRDLLALAKAVGGTLRVRGHRNDQLTMFEYAKQAADALEDPAEQRWAIHQLAVTQADLGRLAEARDSYARALDLARELGDPDAECAELHGLAELDRGRGLLEKARNGFERALALARELRDPTAELVEVHSLALIDNQTGRLDEARAGYERALALARELGDPAAERDEVRELAVLDRKTGQLEQARQGHLRALELSRQLQNPATEQIDVHDLAMLDAQTGQLAEARVGFTRALDLAWQLGDPAAKRNELHALAVLDTETGRLAEARAGFELALDLARELGDPAAEAVELVNLGLLLAQRMGEPEQGRTMIEHGLATCERLSTVYEIGQAHWFLASIDQNQGNRAAAVAHYREALRRFEQVQSPDADEVRDDLRALGEDV